MQYKLVGAITTAVLLSTASTLAIAQMSDKGGGGGREPAAKSEGPTGGSTQSPGSSQRQGAESSTKAQNSEPKGSTKSQRSEGKSDRTDTGKRAQESKQPARERTTSDDAGKKGEPKRAQGREETPNKGATRDTGKDQRKSAEQPSKDQRKSAEQPSKDRNQKKSTEAPAPSKDAKSAQQGGRVQVSEQQRSQVRERLMKGGKVEKTKIDVRVNVGGHIPRSVHLLPLAAGIIEFAPAYRGYSYVVLEDETVYIVDPKTYVVVDVIPVSTQRADRGGGHRAQLSLSTEQMRFIFANVEKDRRADVRIKLALGAEVPGTIELHSLPTRVIERVPEARDYRYIVVEDQVVLVDPSDHQVALVITD